MKQHYLILGLYLIAFSTLAQTPLFKISPENLDQTVTNFYGDQLNADLENDFSDAQDLINYNPTFSFDGIEDYIQIEKPISNLSQMTLFTVFQPSAEDPETQQPEADIWQVQGEEATLGLTTQKVYSSNKQSFYQGLEPNKPVLHTFLQLHKNRQRYPNQQSSIILGTAKQAENSTYFKGNIGTLVAYNQRLRGVERQKIETSLALKYGITLGNGENYLSSDKKNLWNSEKDSLFTNNIAGIGRDDKLELYQKQASSSNEDEFLVISVNEKAPSNKLNPSEIPNENFLVWGDNQADLLAAVAANDSKPTQLNRQWLLTASGGSVSTLNTELQLKATELFGELKPKNEYLLAIDRSGNGDFDPAQTDYVPAHDLTQDNTLIFKNVQWDVDNSGKDQFTIALYQNLEATITPEATMVCPEATTTISYNTQGGIAPYQYTLANTQGFEKIWSSSDNEASNQEISEVPSGEFTLSITDRLGNSLALNTTIEEETPLTVDLGPDQTLEFEQSLELNPQISDPSNVATYSWTQSKSDFSSTEETVSITEPGNYTLTVTTPLGCTYSDSVTIRGSYIREMKLQRNPVTNGSYSIKTKMAERTDLEVSLYNGSGMILDSFTIKNKQKTTIKGKVPRGSGIYIVRIATQFGTVSKKIIVE